MEGQEQEVKTPTASVDPLTAAETKILKPTCPGCGADPIVVKRLRYEFDDGVVIEILFCRNPDCRVAIGTFFVGIMTPAQMAARKAR
jgi:hypothetical protein